jgi:hypothetical protein
MRRMTRPTFLEQLLRRLLPPAEPAERRTAWLDSDSSWRSSSFELAQGLQVIEHYADRVPPSLGFPDTLPAFHEPAPATVAQRRA